MRIIRATPNDLNRIRRLLQRGRHVFQNLGREDWQALLTHGVVLLGVTGGGLFSGETPVALLGLRREPRPATLPSDAPSRAYVTCAAVARGRSAITDIPALIEAAVGVLREEGDGRSDERTVEHGWQLIYYDADNWLVRPLLAANFAQVDRVQFLELSRLSRRVDELRERLAQSVAQAVNQVVDDGWSATARLSCGQPRRATWSGWPRSTARRSIRSGTWTRATCSSC